MMNSKRSCEVSAEVKAAVDDLLNGTTRNTTEEWLQREYIRLLRREANYKRNESKFQQIQQVTVGSNTVRSDGECPNQDRPDQ